VLRVTEFSIFGEIGNEFVPAGFNAWRECDGELAIGEITEKDYFPIEGTDKALRGVDAPPAFWECNPQEREEKIKRNMRSILQLFNIRVLVYQDRVEIKGTSFHLRSCTRGRNQGQKLVWLSLLPSLFKGRGSGG